MTREKSKTIKNITLVLSIAFLLTITQMIVFAAPPQTKIEDQPVPLASATVRQPKTGSVVYGDSSVSIDASNVSQGYMMVSYGGGNSKVKVQITKSGGTTYTYNLNTSGKYEVFPLTAGDGNYGVNVFENISGNQYALAYGTSIDVALESSLLPFLYPSQYVNYNAQSESVKKGESLTNGSTTDLEKVTKVYNYVIKNIKYDDYKASTVKTGYLPAVDSILASGKGICFDYAALMATMLRSQNIPTQLRVGYVSGGVYHAWISVYTKEQGWINNAVYFDGQSWKMMDPTFASSGGQSSSIMQFIGNGSNYSTSYVY